MGSTGTCKTPTSRVSSEWGGSRRCRSSSIWRTSAVARTTSPPCSWSSIEDPRSEVDPSERQLVSRERTPMKRRRVGVLMGGFSAERDVSLRTGEGVAEALESRGHLVSRLVWSEDGPALDELVREKPVDVVFVALHGRGGEDGCVQGMLELLGIPYTGSGVLPSALAMDKLKAKEMFRLHNVPTPPYYVATRDDHGDIEELHGSFGFPAIVKPRREGSSLGVEKVSCLAELE